MFQRHSCCKCTFIRGWCYFLKWQRGHKAIERQPSHVSTLWWLLPLCVCRFHHITIFLHQIQSDLSLLSNADIFLRAFLSASMPMDCLVCMNKHHYETKRGWGVLTKHFHSVFFMFGTHQNKSLLCLSFPKTNQQRRLMHFLNAQFGCRASNIITQVVLTNVWLCPVALTSVYFGPGS